MGRLKFQAITVSIYQFKQLVFYKTEIPVGSLNDRGVLIMLNAHLKKP